MTLPIFEAKHIWQSFKQGKLTSHDFVAHLATFFAKKARFAHSEIHKVNL